MISWYWQKAVGLLVVCSVVVIEPATNAANLKESTRPAYENASQVDSIVVQLWQAQEKFGCTAISSGHQEVYNFETQNFHISICQLEERFYYRRQSKLNPRRVVVIPARAVSSGNIFQAQAGRVTYFVGKSGDRYYSSVMKNNNEIVFEPELEPIIPKLAEDSLVGNNSSISRQAKLSSSSSTVSEAETPNSNTLLEGSNELICTREKFQLHPRFGGWQKLIGKTTSNVNRYAINHGHDFVYNQKLPEFAQINANNGSIINLSITNERQIVEEVCVEASSERD